MVLDWAIGTAVQVGNRADGTMLVLGASVMIITAVVPCLVDYALCVVVHVLACVVVLNLGPEVPGKLSRSVNFVLIAVISVAVAYAGERMRRENVLLTWRLRQSNAVAVRAGARRRAHAIAGGMCVCVCVCVCVVHASPWVCARARE